MKKLKLNSKLSLKENDLKKLFDDNYAELCLYAKKFVYRQDIAEEITQEVFIQLWQRKDLILNSNTAKSYLYVSVKNRSLNYLKSTFARLTQNDEDLSLTDSDNQSPEKILMYKQLTHQIKQAIEQLPERCRVVFNLSRNSGLSYKEIGTELGISPESVKTQIGIAIKKIKLFLEENK